MEWVVRVWEGYVEVCVEEDMWKGNGVGLVKEGRGKGEEEMI